MQRLSNSAGMHACKSGTKKDREYPGVERLQHKGEPNEMPIPNYAAGGTYPWAWWVLHS